MDPVELEFCRWETTPPPELFGDAIWRLPAYRISRYLALVVRTDADTIRRRSPSLAEQLERAVDSIGINISEGYGRLHGRERARFYEFALGSAREAREWYARAGSLLEDGVAMGRAKLLTRAIKILTVAIPQERAGSSERRMRDAILRARGEPGTDGRDPASSSSTSSGESP
jgi:four helix bundle protein